MNLIFFVLAIATFARPFHVHAQDVAQVVGSVDHEAEQKKFHDDAAGVALDDASSMLAKPQAPAPKPVMRSEKEKAHHHKKKHHKKHKEHKEEEKVAAQVNVPHKINVTHKVNVTNKVYWDGTVKTQPKVPKVAVQPTLPKLEATAKEKEQLETEAKLNAEMEREQHAAGEKLAEFAKAAAAVRASQAAAGDVSTRCVDYPRSWVDSQGDYCYMYEYARLCTPNKGYGAYWSLLKGGNFSNYAVTNSTWAVAGNPVPVGGGVDATFACCACGGGTIPFVTTTGTTTTGTTTTTSVSTNLADPGFHSLVDDDSVFNLFETS